MNGPLKTTRNGDKDIRSATGRTGRGKYNAHLAIPAAYMYMMGASDEEVAIGLGVTHATVVKWTKIHPEFAHAKRESHSFVKARLANALINAAEGAQKVEVVEEYNSDDNTWTPIKRKTTEMPPNPQAAIAWLHAQASDEWRAKQEIKVEVDQTVVDLLHAGRERMAAKLRELIRDGDGDKSSGR